MNFQNEEIKEFLNIFSKESDEFIRKIYSVLDDLKINYDNNDRISELLFAVHSLKSLLGAVKFTEIQKIVHNIENILIIANNNEIKMTDNFINSLYYLFNFTKRNIESSVAIGTEKLDNTELKKISDLLKYIENNKSFPVEYYEDITRIEQKNPIKEVCDVTGLRVLLNKIVQDTAEVCGKKVDLIFVKTDKPSNINILKFLKNVLIHILKNAVYHGIENPEDRIISGKSPIGKIQVNISNTKENFLIEISDDGQGFNLQKIKDKAIEKALFSEEKINDLSNDELINLTFLSGFSTSDETTVISGRGIGMNIIQNEIAQLNGSIKISTKPSNGAKFQIKIPN